MKINREHIQALSIISSDHMLVYVGTQILRCSTGFSDGAILKPREIEITKDYFVVVILCVVHQILQLKNTGNIRTKKHKKIAEDLSKNL